MKYFVWLLFITGISYSQTPISGIVKDGSTGKPIPFAKIIILGHSGFLSDIDGKFTLPSDTKANEAIHVEYPGYNDDLFFPTSKQFVTVLLYPDKTLSDIIKLRQQNAALNVIKQVIASRDKNDPQKKLRNFRFKSYNKLIITANPDSIAGKVDSVFTEKRNRKIFSKIDSSQYKFKKYIEKHHLFQAEKVSDFTYNNSRLKETILAIKMGGFQQPVYEAVALDLQSFSIYEKRYELVETDYPSPVADNALQNYDFTLVDDSQIDGRSSYVLYFKSSKNDSSRGLHGALYIDAASSAVIKAVVRHESIMTITATHKYQYAAELDLWFPSFTEVNVSKGYNDENIRILGETLQFDTGSNDLKIRDKQPSDFTYLSSKSSYSDPEFNVPLTVFKPGIAIDIPDSALNQPESLWEIYRTDTTDLRSRTTYFALDSIAQKRRVEKKLRFGRKIINGYVPVGPFDIDLRYLLSYNNYEGFRIGFGGITNEQFSTKYRVEGYSAYGTKDGNFKYNLGAAARIGKFTNTWIGGAYTDDVREIGSTSFAIDKRVFKIYDPRPINVSTFYNHVSWRGYIETKLFPKTESIWQLTNSRIEPKFNYVYNLNGELHSIFRMTTASMSLQWNPYSEYMQTPTGRLESEKRFPKFTFQVTQSIPGLLDNDFDFTKIDVRAEYEKKFLNGQKTSILTEAGYAFGETPLTHLYNTSPNNLTKDRLLQRITFAGKNSFETMYFNEFFSSKYVMVQLKHGSKRITLFRKIRPSAVLVTRMAWGTMDNPERHVGIDYKTLEKGYFESGIELSQIYKGLGLSGFYRYGANQLPRFEDNVSIKLSFMVNLGF